MGRPRRDAGDMWGGRWGSWRWRWWWRGCCRAPYLAAHFGSWSAESGGAVAELKRRVLYQAEFTSGGRGLGAVARENFIQTFVPGAVKEEGGVAVAADAGWMFVYMTPGIYVASLLGLVYLLAVRQWYVAGLLGVWLVLMLGPPIVLGNVIYSRYVLPGTIPFLIAAAWLLGGALGWIFSWRAPGGVAWGAVLLVMGGLLVLPLREIGRQATHWQEQMLTAQDRYQYVEGWNAGWATEAAIRVLKAGAAAADRGDHRLARRQSCGCGVGLSGGAAERAGVLHEQ